MGFFQAAQPINQKQLRIRLMIATLMAISTAIALCGKSLAASSSIEGQDLHRLRLIEFKPPPKAPNFALKDLRGNVFRLESFQGKPLMLYFWATW